MPALSVKIEMISSGEFFSTKRAFVWFFPSMSSHVTFQLIGSSKSFRAALPCTAVWLLTKMMPIYMCFQIVSPWVFFITTFWKRFKKTSSYVNLPSNWHSNVCETFRAIFWFPTPDTLKSYKRLQYRSISNTFENMSLLDYLMPWLRFLGLFLDQDGYYFVDKKHPWRTLSSLIRLRFQLNSQTYKINEA